jgi:hypothetical protein
MIKAGFYDRDNNRIPTSNVIKKQINNFGLTSKQKKGKKGKESTLVIKE